MTVAAIILAVHHGTALREVEGLANARRLADTAWAGGAHPIIVVAPDTEGAVSAALAGSPAVLVLPGPECSGPVEHISRAFDIARAQVHGTGAALLWPARMGWVDAETVTSLIEAHGANRSAILRPAFRGEPGWPALVPVEHLEMLRGLAPARKPPELLADLAAGGAPSRLVDLGDPGAVHDVDTPRDQLPPFEGPAEPPAAHQHEWGSPAAAGPDEAPGPPRIVG